MYVSAHTPRPPTLLPKRIMGQRLRSKAHQPIHQRHPGPHVTMHPLSHHAPVASDHEACFACSLLHTDRLLHLTACGCATRWVCVEPSGWTTGTTGDSCGLVSTLGSAHDRSAYLLLGGLFTLRPCEPTTSAQPLANHSNPRTLPVGSFNYDVTITRFSNCDKGWDLRQTLSSPVLPVAQDNVKRGLPANTFSKIRDKHYVQHDPTTNDLG